MEQGDDPPTSLPPAEPPDDSLFAAIRADDVQRLERALSEGASVNSTMNVEAEKGLSAGVVTALMRAITLGRNNIAKLLLERGADVHARRPHNSMTALRMAAMRGNVETVGVLAELGACVKTPKNNGATPVFIAAQIGHTEMVRVLAELGACVKTPNNHASRQSSSRRRTATRRR